MKLGKHMQKAYDFIQKVNGWHGYAQDKLTRQVIKRLQTRGLIEVNEFQQFRLTFTD